MLNKVAINVLKNCMDVKKNEKVLVITDSKLKKIGNVFLWNAKKITKKADLVKIPIPKVHGTEPPKDIAKLMLKYNVILAITIKSLSHTKARKNASNKGARIATMPGITEDTVKRTLIADYKKIKEKNLDLIKKLKKGKIVRVRSKKGTDISLEIFNKKWFDDSGVYTKKRAFGNLPAGEVGFMPTEGKTNGVFIVDGSIGGLGLVDKPVKIFVKDGFVIKVLGGKTAKKLKRLLITKKHKNIAEFAFGTNPEARITGLTLEDEKVLGTIHIAMGNNQSYGGSCDAPFHVDGIIKNPDVFIDDKLVMKKGGFLI
jgi:leucyl aminopeptidase (aminopeptidase T)